MLAGGVHDGAAGQKGLEIQTDILPVSVSETDASLTHHRLEACATLIVPPEEVRAQFKRVKPLKETTPIVIASRSACAG